MSERTGFMKAYCITTTFETEYTRFNIHVKKFDVTNTFSNISKFSVFILYVTVIVFSDNNVNLFYS